MYCRKCGREIARDARFCPFCGSERVDETPNDDEARRGGTRLMGTSLLRRRARRDEDGEGGGHGTPSDAGHRASRRPSSGMIAAITVASCAIVGALVAIAALLVGVPGGNSVVAERDRWGNTPANISLDGSVVWDGEYDYFSVAGSDDNSLAGRDEGATIHRARPDGTGTERIYELPVEDDAWDSSISCLNEWDGRLYFISCQGFPSTSVGPQSSLYELRSVASDGSDERVLVSWDRVVEVGDYFVCPERLWLYDGSLYVLVYYEAGSPDGHRYEVHELSLEGEDLGVAFAFDDTAEGVALSEDASRLYALYAGEEDARICVQERGAEGFETVCELVDRDTDQNVDYSDHYSGFVVDGGHAYYVELTPEHETNLVRVSLEGGEPETLYSDVAPSDVAPDGGHFTPWAFRLASLADDAAYLICWGYEEGVADDRVVKVPLDGGEAWAEELPVYAYDGDRGEVPDLTLSDAGDHLVVMCADGWNKVGYLAVSPDLAPLEGDGATYALVDDETAHGTTAAWQGWGNAPANISIGRGLAVSDDEYDYFVSKGALADPRMTAICRRSRAGGEVEPIWQVRDDEDHNHRVYGLNVWEGRLYFVVVDDGEFPLSGEGGCEVHAMGLDGSDDRALASYDSIVGQLYLHEGELLALFNDREGKRVSLRSLALDGSEGGEVMGMSVPGGAYAVALSDDARWLVATSGSSVGEGIYVQEVGGERQAIYAPGDGVVLDDPVVVDGRVYVIESVQGGGERRLVSMGLDGGDRQELFSVDDKDLHLSLCGMTDEVAYLEISNLSEGYSQFWVMSLEDPNLTSQPILPQGGYAYYTTLYDAGDRILGLRGGEDAYEGLGVYAMRGDGSDLVEYVEVPQSM